MDAARLRGIIQFLVSKETETKLQERLSQYQGAVSNLASAPAETDRQTAVVQRLAELKSAVTALTDPLTSAQLRDIADVRAYDYFSVDIIRRIEELSRQNGVTPAVLDREVTQFVSARQQYLDRLNGALSGLDAVGIEVKNLAPGEAELEVVLPWTLFESELGHFQEELRVLYRVIRTFTEVANVTPGPIEVRQISSSDPTLFLGIDVTSLVLIGLAIKWGIDIIKSTIEIKKLSTAAKAAGVDDSVMTAIDGQIRKKIDAAIGDKVIELLAGFRGDEARKNELKGPLETALNQLLARMERGMVLEIRMLSPPQPAADSSPEDQKHYQEFEQLDQISKSLDFPKIEGQPALQLTRREPAQSPESDAGESPAQTEGAGPKRPRRS